MQIIRRIAAALLLTLSALSSNGQLTAGFTATPTSGCAPLVVSFTNTTTPSSGTTYAWNLDNGTGIIALTDPGTSYLIAGVYTITLTATNGSATSTATRTITVNPSPAVSFTISDTAMCPGVPATYTSTGSGGVSGPVAYLWSFNDGDTAETATATHAIAFPGYFNITLKVTNADGCTASLTEPGAVHVYTPPVPNFSVSATHACPNEAVRFSSLPAGTPPFSYQLNFGDGSPAMPVADTTHSYSLPGAYTAHLTVTDGHACEDSQTIAMTITNMVAAFTGPDTVCIHAAVTFVNTSTSYTSDKWLYGNGDTSTGTNGSQAFDTSGLDTVRLVTYNGACMDTVAHTVFVIPPPTGITITPAEPCPAPVTATFTVDGLWPGGAVTWNFGDSATGPGNPASHTYTTNDSFFVQAAATYGPGCSAAFSTTYYIYGLSFSLFPGAYLLGGCIPDTVMFSTDDASDPFPLYPYPLKLSWNFGDGSAIDTTDGINVGATHIYTVAGVFHVTITGTSSNGCPVSYLDSTMAGTRGAADTFTATPRVECFHDNQIGFTRTEVAGPVTARYWYFGEGYYTGLTVDTARDSVYTIYHQFVLPGVFSDTLISLYNGCPDTFIRHDYITIDSPESIPYYDFQCSPPNTALFENRSLGDNTHLWIFGDGTTSTLDTVVHTFPASVVYKVLLTTYNIASGCRDTAITYVDCTRPSMSFRANDTAICPDTTVVFTATNSTGSYTAGFEWAIGSSPYTAPQLSNQLYTFFVTPGIYTISLITLDQHLCPDTITKPHYILVASPAVHFTVSPPVACLPNPTTYIDASTDQPGTHFTKFKWVFGDGASDITTTTSVVHAYTATGDYKTVEIVTDNIGCTDSDSVFVPVYRPIASFTQSALRACAFDSIIFTNTSSADTSTFLWSFGDGVTSTLASLAHTYTDSGVNHVTLLMTDTHGCRDTASDSIIIVRPTAAFSVSDSLGICNPFTVHFTNLSTGDSSSRWSFGDGGHSVATNPTYVYVTPGLDTVTLVVTDSVGCTDAATGHIKLYGYNGAFSLGPDSGCAPLTVFFNTGLGNVAPATHIIWDFADGVVSTSSHSDTISHTYLAGYYVPKLIIRDSSCTDTSLSADTIKADAVKPGFRITPNPICPGDSVTLSDTSVSNWSRIVQRVWAFDSTTDTMAAPSVTYTLTGTYAITISDTDAWGCAASVTETVTVNPLPDAGVITSNTRPPVCIGDTFMVQDTVAGGTWRFSNNDIVQSGDSIIAVAPGTDTLSYTVSNSCGVAVAIDTFTVLPPPPPIVGNKVVCVNATTLLSDSVTNGTWQSSAPQVAVNTVAGDSALVTGISGGTAAVTFQADSGCYATAVVTINPLPAITSLDSAVKCYLDSNGSITVTPDSAAAPYQYLWSTGAATASVDSLPTGNYMLQVRDTLTGCILYDTFQIAMPDSLQLTDSLNDDVCYSPEGSISVSLTGGTPPYSYKWSTNATDSFISALKAGSYELAVTDINGCTRHYTFVLADTACPYIIIHNGVSPNGDGINDTWVIEHIQEFPKNTVYVFDKWGTELFKADNYQNDWGGIDKQGHAIPDGTYYYLIKLNTNDIAGGRNTFTGSLLIKR